MYINIWIWMFIQEKWTINLLKKIKLQKNCYNTFYCKFYKQQNCLTLYYNKNAISSNNLHINMNVYTNSKLEIIKSISILIWSLQVKFCIDSKIGEKRAKLIIYFHKLLCLLIIGYHISVSYIIYVSIITPVSSISY